MLQWCVCQSKMPLRLGPDWKYSDPRTKDHARAIYKLAYAYPKWLGHTLRHCLWSLLQQLHAWYSVCFKQVMMSGANLRHCIHKSGKPITAREDESERQVSNNNTHFNASVFLCNIELIPQSLAIWTTFWVFLKETLVDLLGSGFEWFVTAVLAREGK